MAERVGSNMQRLVGTIRTTIHVTIVVFNDRVAIVIVIFVSEIM